MALVLAGLFAAGCAGGTTDPAPSESTMTIGPEDTLPVLGAWESPGNVDRDERFILTLSDDNTYSVSDSCIEMPGRWQLLQGRVELTPKPQENVRCSETHEWPTIAETYEVDGDELLPIGDGESFSRL